MLQLFVDHAHGQSVCAVGVRAPGRYADQMSEKIA
jgi:hypothetical protein